MYQTKQQSHFIHKDSLSCPSEPLLLSKPYPKVRDLTNDFDVREQISQVTFCNK